MDTFDGGRTAARKGGDVDEWMDTQTLGHWDRGWMEYLDAHLLDVIWPFPSQSDAGMLDRGS